MIVWGSYVMKKTLGTGEFYCPNCKTRRRYTHRQPRKWGHLYWIPLLPMEEFDSYVECGTCSKMYTEAALQYDPEKQAKLQDEHLSILISHAIAVMARARGERPSIEAIAEHITALLRITPSLDAIKMTIADERRDRALKQIAGYANGLTVTGKEMVLRAAVGNTALDETARVAAEALGSSLGLSTAHINGLLAAKAA